MKPWWLKRPRDEPEQAVTTPPPLPAVNEGTGLPVAAAPLTGWKLRIERQRFVTAKRAAAALLGRCANRGT